MERGIHKTHRFLRRQGQHNTDCGALGCGAANSDVGLMGIEDRFHRRHPQASPVGFALGHKGLKQMGLQRWRDPTAAIRQRKFD